MKIGSEQRVHDLPVAPRYVLNDPCSQQELQHPVANRRRQPLRNRLPMGQRARNLEGVLVQAPDLLDRLLHRQRVAVERRFKAERDHVEVDVSAI